ncbi:bifunctional DNA-formamidopyrimidine glycosylase/DNA-(apurinic or apyrimidinic site) lyase [Scrofimicrobium sp. R131]|uniref:Bifunctional DNA-formamidopyrimidine glycosylase/DNA-(Apurinic or apyrimidinic site) lyase n=1 Tax=Scrofimicrobium appendicitidis TaxID=3079930 RepID=A0AAU7V4H6_9ACTO
MPELPEVETISSGLARRIVGRTVTEVVGDQSRLFRHNPDGWETVSRALLHREIGAVGRRGKFFWLALAPQDQVGDGTRCLVIHLGMSGQVHAQLAGYSVPWGHKHEHLWVGLDNDASLSFVDQRQFGHLTVSRLEPAGPALIPGAIRHIAPDPLEAAFDLVAVTERARRSNRTVKSLLLDQGLVSGIGNIYADETLFRSRWPGWTRGRELSVDDWAQVFAHARQILTEAIAAGGTSFDELYVNVEGDPGYFSRSLAVYGREGKPCPGCGQPIERIVLEKRSHFYCPSFCGEAPPAKVPESGNFQ